MLKIITEKTNRLDLDNLAVSLGLSCENDHQCQLADSNSYCNERKICECEATRSSTISSECSAQNRGCAEGTFQVIFFTTHLLIISEDEFKTLLNL